MPASQGRLLTLVTALCLSLLTIDTARAATVTVTGLRGITGTTGDPGNPGAAGGPGSDGGDADAVLIGSIDADNSVIAIGGSGGSGGRGGYGEHPDSPDEDADGGPGGDAGRGGRASAVLDAAVTAGDIAAKLKAFGGSGGLAGSGGEPGGDNGQEAPRGALGAGGDAVASVLATAPGNVDLQLYVAGGWGADALPGESGVSGGAVSLGSVLGVSTGGGEVRITAHLQGGAGRGPGAAGVDTLVENALDGSTTGILNLYQIAEGGHTQALDSPAGRASSILHKQGAFDRLQLTAEAVGGEGYQSGDAVAEARADNLDGQAIAEARAAGGSTRTDLPGGRAGDALATSVATSQVGQLTLASAQASGGAQFDLQQALTGTGGDALASAVAHATGADGVANADAISKGGGGAAGGNASGFARAVAGTGGAFSNVFVQGGVSTVSSPYGSATARGEVAVRGSGTAGLAISRAAGGSGSAEAEIDIAGGDLFAGRVTVSAPIADDGTGRVQAYTRARASLEAATGYGDSVASLLGYQSVATAHIVPGEAIVSAALAGNAGADAALARADPALLYAVLGGGYAPDGSGASATFTSSIALSFDTAGWDAGSGLLLALLDPVAAGDAFDALRFKVLVEGVTVLDESFLDAPTALGYFNDHVLDLGDWRTGVVGTLDLEFHLLLTATRPGDAFFVNMVATTVPAPPALWLLGSAMALMVRMWRRTPAESRA